MGAFNGWAQHNVMAFSARAKLLFREVLISQANCIYYMWKLKYRRQTIQLFAIITHNKIIVFITTEKPIPTASKSFVFVKWNRLIPPTVACHPSRKSVLVCVCVTIEIVRFESRLFCCIVLGPFWRWLLFISTKSIRSSHEKTAHFIASYPRLYHNKYA